MADLYSYLMATIFPGFIRRDPQILRAIKEFEGDLQASEEMLTFTVPALFEFVRRSREDSSGRRVESGRDSYSRFRRALYGNPTNRQLEAMGGRVAVHSPNPDHDLSIYRLERDVAPG